MERPIDSGKITPEQFCYWLQGVFEVAGPATLNAVQVKTVREHLALVFDKQTPNHSVSPEVDAPSVVEPARPRPSEQTGAFIIGKAGTGKTTIARKMVGENLRNGKTVIILDCGSSYDELVQEIGGEYRSGKDFGDKLAWLSLVNQTAGNNGNLPLFVFDLSDLSSGETAEIPPFFRSSIGENIFVLVDEYERVSEKFPELKSLMRQWVERGASFCIVGQDGCLCFQTFAELPIEKVEISNTDNAIGWVGQIPQPRLQPGRLVC